MSMDSGLGPASIVDAGALLNVTSGSQCRRWKTSVALPQRLLQQREAVRIQPHRRLQHRGFDVGERLRGRRREYRIVRHVALRGGTAPALEHGADEMHVVTGGDG